MILLFGQSGKVKRATSLFAIVCLCVLTGCSHQGDDSQIVFPMPSQITGQASLDRQTASITLPLDKYGMNEEEFQTTLAAQQIVFAQCVTGSQAISDVTVKTATQTLQYRHQSPQWLYGFWDTDFIAAHGWQPIPGDDVPLGQGLDVDGNKGKACVNEQDFLDLFPVKPGYVGSSAAFNNLTGYALDASSRAEDDSRFIELMGTRSACVTAAGYTIDDEGSFDTIDLDSSWSDEQTLKAVLAAAQCDDDANITQQAGDINATYQQ